MSAAALQELHAFLGDPPFVTALASELQRARASCMQWPGVLAVRSEDAAALPHDPVFAWQQLPQARLVHGESVRELAEAAFVLVDPLLDGEDLPFAVHAFVPQREAYRTIAARADLVGKAWQQMLATRRRRTHRRLVEGTAVGAVWPGLRLVQLALVGRTSLLVSASTPRVLALGGVDLAPWPAGHCPVAEDKTAPSRAYRKLVEGFGWLGEAPLAHHLCVDLGGSPGGWAWTVLQRGSKVIAVDRSPLEPPALGHPRLTMIQGNAFTYLPERPVDWLLCDVICEPARTVDLVDRWMGGALCARLVATIKFKGPDGYSILSEARVRLARHNWFFLRFKHLHNHHNEVAILASRQPPGDAVR